MDSCPQCGYDNTIKQQWKPLEITNGEYAVSDLGNFISYRIYPEGRLLKTVVGSHGYPLVGITMPDGERTTFTVHRLVMDAFGGERPDGSYINHIDGVKTNAAFTNLEYVTPAGNLQHAAENDLMQHGVDRWNSKLTPEKVIEIRNSDEQREVLAVRFGVSFETIVDVQYGRTWKRVGGKLKSKNPPARLSDDDVREIRKSKLSGLILADRYNVSPPTISSVRNRRKRANVPD